MEALIQDEINEIIQDLHEMVNEEDVAPAAPARKVNLGVNVELWRCLGDPSFSKQYRMPKTTFHRLVMAVGNHFLSKNIDAEDYFLKVPLDLSLLMSIWILGTNDTFRSVAIKFGKAESVVYHQYFKVINALVEMASQFIAWPNERERRTIKFQLERRYGYPGVVGAIDGTHIYISAPVAQRNRYVNRHHRYSILAQAVCDHRMVFRDIYVGEPGSVGDARMFNRSDLRESLYQNPEMFSEEEHLLGDSAYPLSEKLLIPYPHGTEDQRERHHNRVLSSCRSLIERSFALLKNKFRRLKYMMCYSIPTCVKHIVSCFVLHNFIILEGEPLRDGFNDVEFHRDEQWGPLDDQFLEACAQQGAVKREFISHLLQVQA